MAAEPNTDSRYAAIDEALAAWRQGDCVLGEHWFVHRFDPALPATPEATTAATSLAPETDLAEAQVAGLIVVSQTCDVVRPCGGRFVTVQGQVTTLEDMTAADYVSSDPLDLDHLSGRSG